MRMFLIVLLMAFIEAQTPPSPPSRQAEPQQYQQRPVPQQLPPNFRNLPHNAMIMPAQGGNCSDQHAIKLTAQDKTVWCLW